MLHSLVENYGVWRLGLVGSMVVDELIPSLCVIRFHKKKIESSPSIIFPQGMVTTKVLQSAHTICNLQQ
jgi:hypothetical protein